MRPAVAPLIGWLLGCGSSPLRPQSAARVVPPTDAAARGKPAVLAADAQGPALGPDQGAFALAWRLALVGSKRAVTCDQAGTPTVALTISPSGGGPATELSVACERLSFVTPPLPTGTYHLTIGLRDASNRVVSVADSIWQATSATTVDLGELDFQIQRFQLAWSLTRDGRPVSCQAARAATVELSARLGTGPEVSYTFPCAGGEGATSAIQIGTYQLVLRLLGPGKTVLWESGPPTELHPVVFSL